MRIRTFDEADSEVVIGLWERCGLLQPSEDPREIVRRKASWQPELFLVGEENGLVIATVMAGYEGNRGWVSKLAVEPECQRKGLGRSIMQEAERRLSAVGCPKINLQVRVGNEKVIGFYEGLGFVTEPRVSMGKRLTAH